MVIVTTFFYTTDWLLKVIQLFLILWNLFTSQEASIPSSPIEQAWDRNAVLGIEPLRPKERMHSIAITSNKHENPRRSKQTRQSHRPLEAKDYVPGRSGVPFECTDLL